MPKPADKDKTEDKGKKEVVDRRQQAFDTFEAYQKEKVKPKAAATPAQVAQQQQHQKLQQHAHVQMTQIVEHIRTGLGANNPAGILDPTFFDGLLVGKSAEERNALVSKIEVIREAGKKSGILKMTQAPDVMGKKPE